MLTIFFVSVFLNERTTEDRFYNWQRHGTVFLGRLFTIRFLQSKLSFWKKTRFLLDRPCQYSYLSPFRGVWTALILIVYFNSHLPYVPSLMKACQRLVFTFMPSALYYIFAGMYSGPLHALVLCHFCIKQIRTVPSFNGVPITRISLSWLQEICLRQSCAYTGSASSWLAYCPITLPSISQQLLPLCGWRGNRFLPRTLAVDRR